MIRVFFGWILEWRRAWWRWHWSGSWSCKWDVKCRWTPMVWLRSAHTPRQQNLIFARGWTAWSGPGPLLNTPVRGCKIVQPWFALWAPCSHIRFRNHSQLKLQRWHYEIFNLACWVFCFWRFYVSQRTPLLKFSFWILISNMFTMWRFSRFNLWWDWLWDCFYFWSWLTTVQQCCVDKCDRNLYNAKIDFTFSFQARLKTFILQKCSLLYYNNVHFVAIHWAGRDDVHRKDLIQ